LSFIFIIYTFSITFRSLYSTWLCKYEIIIITTQYWKKENVWLCVTIVKYECVTLNGASFSFHIYIYLYINEWKSKPEHLYVIIIDIQILPCYNDAVVVKSEIIGISISNICFIWTSRSLNRHMITNSWILKYLAMSQLNLSQLSKEQKTRVI